MSTRKILVSLIFLFSLCIILAFVLTWVTIWIWPLAPN